MKNKMEKIMVYTTKKPIDNYKRIETLQDVLNVDFVYFFYGDKEEIREATQIEKQLIKSLYNLKVEAGYGVSGME